MPTDFDAYRILDVPPWAGQSDIEEAYRRLSEEYGARAEGDEEAAVRLREVNAAYAVLRDPEQRREYDERRSADSIASPEDSAQAAEAAGIDTGAPPRRAPWGIGDMVKAVVLVIVGAFIISIPAFVIASIVAGDAAIDEDATALAIVIGVSVFLQLLLLYGAYRFSVRKYKLDWSVLGLRKPQRTGALFPIGLAISAYAVVIVYFGTLGVAFDVEPDTAVPEEVFDHVVPIIALGIVALVLAPIFEEIFFRGFVFGGLRGRWGVVLGALASGLLFGVFHIDAGSLSSLWVVPPISAVGILFAWGYLYSGSLIPPMIAHFLFNLVSFSIGVLAS